MLFGCVLPQLKVEHAPDPSTILWENLGTGLWNRIARRLFTTVLSILLVFVSFLLLCWASYQQKKAIKQGGSTLCPGTPVTMANVTANPGPCVCRDACCMFTHTIFAAIAW